MSSHPINDSKLIIIKDGLSSRHRRSKRFLPVVFLAVALLLLPAGSNLFESASSSSTIPIINILSVVQDESVTIRTSSYPANTDFTATMGPMGTQGINGVVVGTVNSGNGGSFDATFPIPAELRGSNQLSIRLQSGGSFPYFSYNWFYNNTTSSSSPPPSQPETPQQPIYYPYNGIPTFKVIAVDEDTSATIQTHNFPPDQTFTVTMGPMGTRGINGKVVGTLDSGSGGQLIETYAIPDELKGHTRISIRAQTENANPYYAYNWFWNNDASVQTIAAPESGMGGEPEAATPESDKGSGTGTYYTGLPVMTITSVVRNQSVTFQTHNYPPNQTFDVTMGPMGTQGINGIHTSSFNSGDGGSFPVTMPIPSQLAESYQISIRAQTPHAYPFFSYNWFYNNTTQ